jgi:hypothetical protein
VSQSDAARATCARPRIRHQYQDWVVPAGPEARRFAVFNVSDKYCFNGELSEGARQTYFDALITQMKSGGIEAMFFDLLRRDLSGYHPSIILSNKALAEQKQLTMEPLVSWWYDMVERGQYPCMGGPVIKERNVVSSESLLSAAKDYDPVLERMLNPQVLGRFLREQGCVNHRAKSFRAWKLPPLPQACASLAKRYGFEFGDMEIDWNDVAPSRPSGIVPFGPDNGEAGQPLSQGL